ncbi:Uncharacterised protein [uncultured Flavonifractor sp.]|nr:non-specific serine/threonine protein kinase [Flavonifractor plautii]SCJ23706.1 Uncharacterised protein [uncultured Flavonifractor sp.]
MNASSLMKVTYFDPKNQIRLLCYADTVVWNDKPVPTLTALRFGGYPERVQGLADAIYGGATIEIEDGKGTYSLKTLTRQYRRELSHDGVYAEATLIAEDDGQSANRSESGKGGSETEAQEDEDDDQIKEDLPPRNTYIFCTPGDRRELFDAVDQKTAVPMIPEYQEYVLNELVKRNILRPLQVKSLSRKLEAWLLRCEGQDKNIVAVMEDGLKSGAIAIPGSKPGVSPLDEIHSVTEYLNTFGVTVAEQIKKLFIPLFDPSKQALSPEILAINQYTQEHAGYSLYDAQLAVAEAIKRQLERSKVGLIVAECGVGKSKIGAASIAAVAAGMFAHQKVVKQFKTFNLVLCPSHVTDKWVREIEETLPNTFAAVVHNPSELDHLYQMYQRGVKSCFAILSKEKARDGYMRAPAVVYRRWNREALPVDRNPPLHDGADLGGEPHHPVFCCPSCGAVVMAEFSRDSVTYRVPANSRYFRREHTGNHKCAACGEPLWSALNPDAWLTQKKWAKIGGYGFIYRPLVHEHFKKTDQELLLQKLREIEEHPDACFPAKGAYRAYALSTYIKHKYKGRIYGLIVDELHEYNNKSGQGEAMAELYGTAKKVVGMTATLINGYSSGIFHLLYRLVPNLMRKDGKRYEAPAKFDAEYGVIQNIYVEEEPEYHSNRRTVQSKKNTRLLPGVSPLVYSRFLMEKAAFLCLSDMGKDLPEYEEIPVALQMPAAVEEEYKETERQLKSILKNDKKAARKILSAYLNLLTAYPDQPYGHKPVYHPLTGEEIVKPEDTMTPDELRPKDEEVLKIVERKIAAGEKVLIYTNWTRLDTQTRLQSLLSQRGWNTIILPAKVKPANREQWVADRLSEGLQVLISNPTLVQTGLDLNAFTTVIFYDTGYKLFTLRQASRRSWRINQTAPRVEVYMLYYASTMQHKAIKLMATKLAAAGIIEGSFSEEGLAAMSECEDMTTLMAKELMLGIKDSVEDVSAMFKRMASLKPQTAAWSIFAETPTNQDDTELLEKNTSEPLVEFTFDTPVNVPAAALHPAFVPATAAQSRAKTKPQKSTISEDQILLFKIA